MRFNRFFWILLFSVAFAPSTSAQDISPVISVDNIRNLQSVLWIDWADWSPQVDRGWVSIDPTGNLLAILDRGENLITLDANTGTRLNSYSVLGEDGLPTTFLDAAFSADSQYQTSIHVEGGAYTVAYRPIDAGLPVVARVVSPDVPLRVWADDYVWLEMVGNDVNSERYVLQTEYPAPDTEVSNSSDWPKIPSGPENDPDSFLRVGRIIPPAAITATQDGLLKRWNLETGEVTATAQIEDLPGAGQLNADGHYFVWIDQGFNTMHLLDFETGEDKVITQLNETYIPFILLSQEADVIIGVNVALEPAVIAWDVVTGERIDLGEYRSCNRQPDMVRLSNNGTTLVIGCDTGLDIWRIY